MIESKEMFNVNIKNTTVSIDDMVDSLLENKEVRDFIVSNNLSQKEVESSLNKFLEYLSDNKINKEGVLESKSVKGYRSALSYENSKVTLKYVRLNPITKKDKHIKLFNLPKELKESSFEDFDLTTQDRRKVYQYARRFVDTFSVPSKNKGLYLAGPFRSGKTYLASAIANEVAQKGFNVIEVYYPELSIMLKGSLADETNNSFTEILDDLKNVDLLILDDFGGEAINPFIRDEALGVVLNYRMTNKLSTIITSNIQVSKLADTALRKDSSDTEKVKALRIVERVKELTEEYYFFDKYEKKEGKYYEN